MKEGINIPVTVDAKDLPYEMDKAVSVVERATKGMSKSLGEAVKESGFHYKSLQEAYSTTVRHAELLAVTLGEDSKAYKDAVIQAQNYGTAMSKVQMDIGKTTNGVKSSYNGLAMSMAQLTREAPAFTYSMTTGFMAISNNLPILFDEIKKTHGAGAGLANTFKAVASALFSWQTAISLGITVLTVFGSRIWEAVTANEQLNDALTIQQHIIQATTNKNIDSTQEIYKRTIAVKAQLEALKNGTSIEEETIKLNEKKIAKDKEALFLGQFRTKQIVTANGMKIVSNKLTESETKTINDNIKSLTDQNNALKGLVTVEKQLDSLQGKKKQTKNSESHSADIKAMKERLSMFKAKYFGKEMLQDSIDAQYDINGAIKEQNVELFANEDAMLAAAAAHENFFTKLGQNAELMKSVSQTLTTSFNAVGVAIGDAFATGDFGGSALKFLADFMAIVGSAAIAVGVAYQAMGFSIGQGIAAVGAGVALIAASRIVGSKAGGSGGGGGMTSSNVNSQGFQGGSYQFAPTSSYLDVSGLVRGQDIVIATNNTNRNNKRVRR